MAILNGLVGRIEKDYPLSRLTTWKIGGPAEVVFWPENLMSFVMAWKKAREQSIPVRVIGKGSNLLAPDEGLPGLTLVTTALQGIEWNGSLVRVEAGVSLARLAQDSGQRGLSGLEFARGIPGTVGGAVIMNAGAHGGEMAKGILSVRVLMPNGDVTELKRKDIEFGYRYCSLRGKAWMLEVELELLPGRREDILKNMTRLLEERRNKQPLDKPNAGSVFRNPPGDSAGRLIEAAGWKGVSYGGAQVSEKHANFIVNQGNAKASDVLELIKRIQADVKAKFNIHLETEVEFLR